MNKQLYPNVDANPDFSSIENKILKFWQENNIFEKSVENREKLSSGKNNEFIFYDGPPFANGLPHYGHLLTGYIKDTYARYQTIKGKRVERRFGWDCHGLPAEMGAEKELGISGRLAITEYGIDKFNDTCKTSVMKFTDEWKKYVTQQARWVDFDNSYKTMDTNFMESVIWAFSELYKKGLVYESLRVMPYSWACETPLSNFETRLDNSYRERKDKAVTVKFKIKHPPTGKIGNILAWTTTPWTLPSNLALAVGSDIDYVCFSDNEGEIYIMAKFAFENYKEEMGVDESNIHEEFKGSKLEGMTYEPLFEYFKDHENAFKILTADFVEEGDGTGIVHIAPGFGEDDQLLCEKNNIKIVCPVDNAGKFTSEVPEHEGKLVFDANDEIIKDLKKQGSWLKTEQYIHNYPHCWRTDTPLIYKAVPSWYVKVTDFKHRMSELNKQINWIPGHVKDGLFGKWLENARDWSISRNRFWGTPIPIWRSDDPKYPRIDVYGSIEELQKDFGVEVKDLHRPFIDSLTRKNPDDPTGKSMMRRVEDVFDCWFESGSMPYGQAHYPFENKEWFETHFPADFIVEYSAQTRGWFYTLMVLSTALFDRPPFLNCICHGVILDDKGQKLSKRLQNYADPLDIFSKYSSDSLRYTMLSSTVVKGQELLVDKEGEMVREVLRLYIKPIWNAYNFFVMYANSDQIEAKIDYSSENYLDKYILSKLKKAVKLIDNSLSEFNTLSAYDALTEFFEVLNNWYIRRSRPRFWESEKSSDKFSAYNTLFTCLDHISVAASPLIPILTEEIYKGLWNNDTSKESVHLRDYPDISNIKEYTDLMDNMDIVRDICSTGLNVRNQTNIRVRQPLNSVKVILKSTKGLEEFASLIKDELNVKTVEFSSELENHADEVLKINFPVLGKRLPSKMKEIIAANKKGDWSFDKNNLKIANETLLDTEFNLTLVPKSKDSSETLSKYEGLIILDTNISEELEQEGIARDIIRFVQQARKDADLNISDRICLSLKSDDSIVKKSIENFTSLIEDQTLSNISSSKVDAIFKSSVNLNASDLEIEIKKS